MSNAQSTAADTAAPSIPQDVFALRIRDDSMVDNAGSLSFPVGGIIVVDPTVTAMPGDHVIVRLKTADEAIFRKLECDGDMRLLLKPLNPAYPSMPLSSDAKIAGVAVQVNIETWGRRVA